MGISFRELAYFKAIACGSHPGKNYNFIFTPRNINELKKLILNINKIKNKNYKIEEIYEYIYMYMLRNNDAFKNNARSLKLKNINWQKSKSLDIFLKRYNT